ncbi:hypothetical protein L6R53_03045 [Myxococcota bacterium]|nr:hypothetical protein [Myxococcota bacterium]
MARAPLSLVFVGLLCLSPARAAPTELLPGVVHPAGAELTVGELGLAFTIPAGCQGALSAELGGLVLACGDRRGLALAAGQVGLGADGLRAALSSALPLDPSLTLVPAGAPVADGTRLRVDYTLPQAPDHGGVGLAVAGDNGAGVLLVAAGPNAELPAWRDSLEALAGSLRFSAPAAAAASTAPPAEGTPQGALADTLRGKRLRYLHSNTGFTDEWSIDLCSDGRFQYRRSSSAFSSGFSGDFSAATADVQAGAWSVQGQVLTLRYEQGTVEQAPLVQQGGAWVHGQTRYFLVDENDTCR